MLFKWFSSDASIQTLSLAFLTYNIVAFGLQAPIGYLADKYPKLEIAQISCVLLIFGLILLKFRWPSMLLMALGNAAFHVGGGIESLAYSGGKISRSGIFVSSGAVGVSLGTLAGRAANISIALPLIMIILSFALIVAFCRERDEELPRPSSNFGIAKLEHGIGVVILLSFISIIVRSYVGSIIPIAWRTNMFLLLLPSICACLGKASGGFLADTFGAKNIGVLSLVLSIPCLTIGYSNPFVCAIGLLLFNMCMSITLCTLASCLPNNHGLAFGISTLALLCGNVPTFFLPKPGLLPASLLITLLTAVSAICIHLSVKNRTEGAILQSQAKRRDYLR